MTQSDAIGEKTDINFIQYQIKLIVQFHPPTLHPPTPQPPPVLMDDIDSTIPGSRKRRRSSTSCSEGEVEKHVQTLGAPNWYELDPEKWARPPPIRELRQQLYNLPSVLCDWLANATKITQRQRLAPSEVRPGNGSLKYLLVCDEVCCSVYLDVEQANTLFE